MRIAGVGGWRKIEGSRDEESHRSYKITIRVEGNTGAGVADGPANALQCPGLPQYGDQWLIDADVDLWAFCRYPVTIRPVLEGEPNKFWDLEFTFTTKPDKAFCLENQIEDPLLKPPKLSGQSVKYTEEAVQDRFGNLLVTSSWEQLRGPQVEFDRNRHRVHIEMPVPALNLSFVTQFIDRVNAFPLWGMNPRCIKLSDFKWDRNFYGVCFPYYTWMFDFDINALTFDRDILDEGTKVLSGHWDTPTGHWVLDNIGGAAPDPTNPQHFNRFYDRLGNVARVILDGRGLPAGVLVGTGTAQPSCGVCGSTTPATVGLTGLGSLAGPATFLGPYAPYNALLASTFNPSLLDPCTFTSVSGVYNASVFYGYETVEKRIVIVVTFYSSDGSAPTASYTAYQVTGQPYNCMAVYTGVLYQGDDNSCPPRMTITGSGTPATGPPYSGPPGVRHVEKYDEADFTLLGIPLVF